jgi:hypothetical protein
MAGIVFNTMKLGNNEFEEFGTRSYLPDAIYNYCAEDTQACTKCANEIYSPVLGAYVHDTQAGKTFCPFGTGNSMNQPINGDQYVLNTINFVKNPAYPSTTWGHAPQLDPRSLARIGLSWRTS